MVRSLRILRLVCISGSCRSYNISPETFVGQIATLGGDEGVEKILNGYLNEPSIRNQIKEQNLTCAASGCMFDRDYQGFLPKLMQMMYGIMIFVKSDARICLLGSCVNPGATSDTISWA